jgi:hypothetical protein
MKKDKENRKRTKIKKKEKKNYFLFVIVKCEKLLFVRLLKYSQVG